MNKSLKVLHICQTDDPMTGGAVRVAVEYVRRLRHQGIDAHCLFLYGSPGYFHTLLGEQAHYLNIQSSREVWKFSRLLAFIKSFDPHVVHHHDDVMWSSLCTFIHPRYRKISHVHLGRHSRNFPVKRKFLSLMQRYSDDALVCIAKDIQNDYRKEGRRSRQATPVIYNGVDNNVFKPISRTDREAAKRDFGWSADTPIVGYVGRLECQMKGVDDFIRVIAKLPPHVKGLVVGYGPDLDSLQALVVQYNLSSRVHFAGSVAQPYKAYCAMDAFCFTSHREPFGLTVIEAMACGIPVLSFPCIGGVNEVLDRTTGCMLLQRDPQLMADAIMRVLNEGISIEKQKNIRCKIETDYSWDNNTEKLALLYQSIATV